MAQQMGPRIWTTRPEAYENIMDSLDVESDPLFASAITLDDTTANVQLDQIHVPEPYGSVQRSYSNLTYESLDYNPQRLSQVSIVGEQLRHLHRRFSHRTDAIKERIHQPPDDDNDNASATVAVETDQKRFPVPSILAAESESHVSTASLAVQGHGPWQYVKRAAVRLVKKSGFRKPVDTDSNLHLTWLTCVAMAYLYNFISVPLRIAFPVWGKGHGPYWPWMLADYFCDLLYLTDMCLLQTRIKYLENGLWVTTFRLTARKYFHSLRFIFDCVSLLPLDLFYLIVGYQALLRLPRLLKLQSLNDFFRCCDRWVQSFFASVRLVRIVALLLYVILWVHVYACIYFLFSNYERRHGVDNGWVYKFETQPRMTAYSYSFYYCFKIASTIGNIPNPVTGLEYVFVTIGYLFALFIFALLIGQIRDVFQSMNQRRSEYQNKVEQVMQYLEKFELPKMVQDRVRIWFQYNWEDRNTLEDDDTTLSFLPTTLQTELAISIHYDTLTKVQLFQDCEKAFLSSLVLKLKPALFLPGDYICKTGEIGREMYIVNHGILDVYIGDKRVAGLEEGSVFGEISLLEVAGGNRRTADVVSRGFSTLFTLHKSDLNEQLKDFPNAGKILRRKAKILVKRSSKTETEKETRDGGLQADQIIVGQPPKFDPKLLNTVFEAVGSKSKLVDLLKRSHEDGQASFSPEVPDITVQDGEHADQKDIDLLFSPPPVLTGADTTTIRIQTLRQKLFSAPQQNLPTMIEHPNDEDDLLVYRVMPHSETNVTLLLDDDPV